MYSWVLARIVLITGIVALLLGILIAIIGLIVYGVSVGTNLLAGASDLLISIAVATFIIDRINHANSRRQWLAAYHALHGLVAAAFVDVMRLLYVYSDEKAYAANVSRYEEFVDIANMHVNDLRGTVQGFAAVIDPPAYTLCRTVERRLSWMVRTLSVNRGRPGVYARELELMATTGKLLAEFIASEDSGRYSAAVHSAETALLACGFTPDRRMGSAPEEVMRYRLPAQSRMIRSNSNLEPRVRGIYYDIDNELAMYYFALDQRLPTGIERTSS